MTHDQLATLTRMVAEIPYRPDLRTEVERARDEWLESIAESRADERASGLSGRECDRRADLYFGGAA